MLEDIWMLLIFSWTKQSLFHKSIQEELEPAITAYEEKSKGKTIMVSTPNAPGGLFEKIENDKNSKYKKLYLD